jgi:Oxidoreductase molybdopterin binding domain/Mo-co oxidoreductase dimerisation domain
MRPEVLIAHQMYGRDLPRDHGFPILAIVPGHYGMASVKWLTRIEAVREPFHGYWQTSDYGYWASMDGKPARRALGEMKLKSQIARPRVYETLPPNCIFTVYGAAWAGETDVIEIEVSTDGGQTWAGQNSWTRCGGMPGDGGNSIGSHRQSQASIPYWHAPRM